MRIGGDLFVNVDSQGISSSHEDIDSEIKFLSIDQVGAGQVAVHSDEDE